jgi:signal transduction histidine kinase
MNSVHEQLSLEEGQTQNKLESLMILARGMSHDINNILTILFGKISMAKDLSKDEGTLLLLSDAEAACVRLCGLSRQIMDLSKENSSCSSIVYLPSIVKSIAELVLRDKRIKTIFLSDNNIPHIMVNEVQIGQVFLNIFINAMQAMPKGGTIIIGMQCVEMPSNGSVQYEGTYIHVSVKDEGMGIPERFIPKIFDYSFSTKPNGTGLGLALCNIIIKNHSGFITVVSKEDKGTQFNVYLPVHVY